MKDLCKAVYLIVAIREHSDLCDELGIQTTDCYIHSDQNYGCPRIALPDDITITYCDFYEKMGTNHICEQHYDVQIVVGQSPIYDIYYRKKIDESFLDMSFKDKWPKIKRLTDLEFEGKNPSTDPNWVLNEKQCETIIEYARTLKSNVMNHLNQGTPKVKRLLRLFK